jgi:general secretion pathway protein B
MSFILDALKKSEGERQRQNAPAFFEVKIAPPRTRLPLWVVALGTLLVLNLGIAAWLVLRQQPETIPSAPIASAPMATAQPTVPAVADAVPPRASVPSPASEADEPAADGLDVDPELFATDEEMAEIREPAAAPSRVTRGTILGVPTYEQAAGTPGSTIPELRLDLHVFANEPKDRFVFLNNRRLREGDALADGTQVENIVPDGVVLSYRGTRFLLQSQ